MGKAKEPPPDPPPPPEKQKVQVHCVPWKVMDFQIEVQLPYLTIEELELIIRGRHGNPIDNLVIYQDDPSSKENIQPAGSTKGLPSAKLFYDYYPPVDPFANRPTACQVYNGNPLLTTTCEAEWEGELLPPAAKGEPMTWSAASRWKNTTQVEIFGGVRKWSLTAEHDPHTQRLLDEEAARIKAEAEAKAAAEAAEAKRIADEKAAALAEKRRKEAEKAAAKKAQEEEEERERQEAEAARLAALEEAARNDPVLQEKLAREKAEAEAAAKKAEAEAKLAKLPKRKPGGALPIFLGGTTKEYYGLDKCTKEEPLLDVPVEKILAEILDKGKISDLYNSKAGVEAYKGEDKSILFCKDEDEIYSDEGFIIILQPEDKEHFLAHIAAGNGIPPPVK